MIDKKKLDELLNAYMDEQLSERRRTEVKRLLLHDPEFAARLAELQKLRALVAALPIAEAPSGILEDIKAKLEHKTLVPSDVEDFEHLEGARQLLWRRAVSIAAIVALGIVLAGVVFTIVGPRPTTDTKVVSENWMNEEIPLPESMQAAADKHTSPLKVAETQAPDANAITPGAGPVLAESDKLPLPERFGAKLQLDTAMFTGVDAFVKRVLLDNGIMLIELPVAKTETGLYNVTCSRSAATAFIADLATIWDKLDSVSFIVATGTSGRNIVIENTTAQQITDVIAATDIAKSIALARNTAALNAMTKDLPTTALAAETHIESLPIPKPVLTSPDKTSKTSQTVDENDMVNLVIQIKNIE